MATAILLGNMWLPSKYLKNVFFWLPGKLIWLPSMVEASNVYVQTMVNKEA